MYAALGLTSLRHHRSPLLDTMVHFVVIMMVSAAVTFLVGAALLGLL